MFSTRFIRLTTSILFSIMVFLFVFSPIIVSANHQPWHPLVQCGLRDGTAAQQEPCGFDDLIDLIRRIISFLIFLGVIIATLAFMYAGVLYITANPNNISKAHTIFKDVLIGFVFLLASWLIVNTIAGVFLDQTFLQTNFWFTR